MPGNYPTYGTIITRVRADVRALLARLDPTIFGSLIRTITDSNAGRHFDNVKSISQLEKMLFPAPDSSRETLEFWARYEEITPFEATQSSGNSVYEGVAGSTVAAGQEYRSASGNIYIADDNVSAALLTIGITSLTRSGSTVTAVTATDHKLATGLNVDIAGAVETDYNGTFVITVIDGVTFSYEITGTPSTPATGTITAECECISVPMVSEDFGQSLNLDSGAVLTSLGTITGISNEGFADNNGFTGGQDPETNANLYGRIIQSRSDPVENFNVSRIVKAALSVQGTTRVKVKRITPEVGDVTILFVRDGDDNIIPTGAQVAEVKAAIVEFLQATSDDANVIVTAPTPVETDYIFSSIVPNTDTMKSAIGENIKAFYEDEATFETDIIEDKYRSAITDTIDPDTGDTLTSFILASPLGDIPVSTDEIGIPGEITF